MTIDDVLQHIDRRIQEHREKSSQYYKANYPDSSRQQDQFAKELVHIKHLIKEAHKNGNA